MTKTERDKMDAGLIYDPGDPAIMSEQSGYLELLYEYNQTRPSEGKKREELLKRMSVRSERAVILNRLFMPIGRENTFFSGNSCMRISI